MGHAMTEFGKLIMDRVRTPAIRDWVSKFRAPRPDDPDLKDIQPIIATLTDEQIETICRVVPHMIDTTLWYVLLMFEEKHEQMRINFKSEIEGDVNLWNVATGDLQGYIFSWRNEYDSANSDQ